MTDIYVKYRYICTYKYKHTFIHTGGGTEGDELLTQTGWYAGEETKKQKPAANGRTKQEQRV